MPLRISQVDDESGVTTLRVEGDLHLEDALMLENLCDELRQRESLVIDLAGITFLDSESAQVLRRLEREPRITLTGLRLFTEKMLEEAED